MQHKDGDPWPKGRSLHVAVCLGYGGQHKKVLISGGLGVTDNVVGDTWLLDPVSGIWEKVRILFEHTIKTVSAIERIILVKFLLVLAITI